MNFLESINSPVDLKAVPKKKLPQLAEEIRALIIDVVSKSGGHLAPSLGAVELAICLHYCYDCPIDKIIWDVGHQAYAHKILTGRREQFATLRQYGGISGFPRIQESVYDALTVGHASTSISAALGMAIARDLKGEKFHVVGVIGDGSLSGGLAFEGLNNVGAQATNMTVILNDNEMSISKNVGALSRYLTMIITDKRFNKVKSDVWELLGNMSGVGKKIRSVVSNIDDVVKRLITPGKFFEDMGLRYIGPIDGHNFDELIDVFNFCKQTTAEPLFIHVLTKKGKGYSFAENNSTKFHGIGTFSISTGDAPVAQKKSAFCDVFGSTLCECAEKNSALVAITAAMRDGTGMTQFQQKYPNRFFDVGIAEAHAVTFAAGLALQGLIPVVALYSTFLQRAYDQIIHDIALDNLHVIFCIDRAGLVGEDGATHHGNFDLSFLRVIPNVTIMAPKDEEELRHMFFTALNSIRGPVFIRYPRGGGGGLQQSTTPLHSLTLYEPEIIRKGKKCAIIALGTMVDCAEKICDLLEADKIKPTLVNARFVKPLDDQFYIDILSQYSAVITLEHNSRIGGFGSKLCEIASSMAKPKQVLCLGYPDYFIPHGNTSLLIKDIELTPEQCAKRIKDFLLHPSREIHGDLLS